MRVIYTRLVLAILLVHASLLLGQETPTKKALVPDGAAQAESLKTIKEVYGSGIGGHITD